MANSGLMEYEMESLNPQVDFFATLLEDIMFGAMIPKVQIERAIGPILGFFLPDVLRARNGKQLVMLCPEFPLRKLDSNQSTNIDWLMFDPILNELVFVELKTTDSSVSQQQLFIYETLIERISKEGATFLHQDLTTIGKASSESGKYTFVHTLMAHKLRVRPGLPDVETLFAKCTKASLVYIAPASAKRPKVSGSACEVDWIAFGDMPPAINSRHADWWPAVRASLIRLDTLDRRARGRGLHGWTFPTDLHSKQLPESPTIEAPAIRNARRTDGRRQ